MDKSIFLWIMALEVKRNSDQHAFKIIPNLGHLGHDTQVMSVNVI